MTEKFTNVAGGCFVPYVAKEIEKRKKFLEESNTKRENKHLIYLNNKNSWFRLTSCTNVSELHPLFRKYNLSGDALAKKYILQGGTVQGELNKQNEYQGITNRSGVGENGLYAMLPTRPLGYKPVPGIVSLDLSSAGRLGTLQYAAIRFICYDIEQLELMDALYMKLGFTLVLEWGHTIFLGENNNLEKPHPLNVFQHNTKESLIKSIQNKRVSHSGNYDAMVGTVSNFGWEVQTDGSYLCDIKLVGAGDILESLKINQSIKNSSNPPNSLEPQDKDALSSNIADKDLSLLNQALFNITQKSLMYKRKSNGTNIIDTNSPGYRDVLNKIFSKTPYKSIKFKSDGSLDGDPISIRGNQFSLHSDLYKDNGGDIVNIPINQQSLFASVVVPYNITDSNNSEPQVYITLGHLLAILTSTGIIYDKNDGNITPKIYIDYNDATNFCSTFKGQVSLDPRVCIIPRNQDNIEDPFGLGIIPDELFNSIGGTVFRRANNSSTTSTTNGFVGSISYSEQSNSQSSTEEIKPNGFVNSYLNVTSSEKDVRARMMYILVNINHITNILRDQRGKDNKGVVNMSSFLNTLLNDISKSLGGFNEFRLSIDDSNKCMRIIDDNKTSLNIELDNDNNYTEIPIYGNKSIVYNYSFKSKIGPNMASMVTIAAQANPSALGDDSFAISNLSRGLSDRTSENKSFSSDIEIVEENNTIPTNLDTLKQHLQGVMGSGGVFTINTNSIDPSLNIYKELLAQYRISQESTNKASVIIPLVFSIEMDGLSGIIPNSAFTIPVNLLPSSYKTKDNKSKIAFILHNITQNFIDNKWTTKIEGQTINIRFDKEDIKTQSIFSPQQQVISPIINDGVDVPVPVSPSVVETNKNLSKLKNTIGYWESGNNYGVANINSSGKRSIINVNGMTFSSLKNQQDVSNKNDRNRVFAAGRFQIVPDTMYAVKVGLKLGGNDRYNPITQEKMADWMLLNYNVRRNVANYLRGSNEGSERDLEKAINDIGYEWASMPVITSLNGKRLGDVSKGTGQYAAYPGIGGNPDIAKVSVKTMVNILIQTRIKYSGKTPIFMPKYYNPYL